MSGCEPLGADAERKNGGGSDRQGGGGAGCSGCDHPVKAGGRVEEADVESQAASRRLRLRHSLSGLCGRGLSEIGRAHV